LALANELLQKERKHGYVLAISLMSRTVSDWTDGCSVGWMFQTRRSVKSEDTMMTVVTWRHMITTMTSRVMTSRWRRRRSLEWVTWSVADVAVHGPRSRRDSWRLWGRHSRRHRNQQDTCVSSWPDRLDSTCVLYR